MIRPPIALIALAALAGGALFHNAFQVSALEDRLDELNAEIRTERDAIHVLRAEWTHLNQPSRLAELSVRYLGMEPLAVTSVADIHRVPERVPDVLLEVAVVDDATDPLPKPRTKPLSPPRFATMKVASAESTAKPQPESARRDPNFNDLLVRILHPVGGT